MTSSALRCSSLGEVPVAGAASRGLTSRGPTAGAGQLTNEGGKPSEPRAHRTRQAVAATASSLRSMPPGPHHVLVHAELLGLEAEREADQLRQVQHRQAEVAVDDLGRVGLLKVEVQVAERARRDERVGVRVDRVADVPAGLLQRRLAVHRDDREAAALARALVVDRLAAERLDHLLEVAVALGMLVVAEAGGRAAGRSSRRRARPAGR